MQDKTDRQVINSQKKIKKQSIGRNMQINTTFKVDPSQHSIDKNQFSINNSVTVSPNAQQSSPNQPAMNMNHSMMNAEEQLKNLNMIKQQLEMKQKANKHNRNTSTDFAGSKGNTQQNFSVASANKKITLNSSMLNNNFAPHLLLQSYHGNGYPHPTPNMAQINNFKSP